MHDDPARRFVAWMRGEALPFWATQRAPDGPRLFDELLDERGVPIRDIPLRILVQCRQIYVLSHADAIGWLPGGAAIAHAVWRAVVALAADGACSRGLAHALTPDGRVADDRRDAYDHAFVVLAGSWLYRATRDEQVLRDVLAVVGFVDRCLTDAAGALHEGMPRTLPRRQNPQMHWFEALLALHAATRDPAILARAQRLREFFEARLLDPRTATVSEYFTDTWQPVDGDLAGVVEPGHLAEWAWLLRQLEAAAGTRWSTLPAALLANAVSVIDPPTGLLPEECSPNGTTRRATHRIWPAAELVKAFLGEAAAGGAGAAARARAAIDVLERFHLRRPIAPGWIDHLAPGGVAVSGPIRASTLYHLLSAAAETERMLLAPR